MKEKRRSNEKRKEKSRDAARCRRSRETDIFTDLASALPVPLCEAAHLDKASVMRLAISYLKTRTLMDAVPKPVAKPEISPEMDELLPKALDGFILILDNNGDMVYLTPNVKDYLGIAQMDLMGQSVFDYSHPCDHDEIKQSFSVKASEISDDHPCNFFLRLKCTLTSKGRKVNLKSASYKVIHCTGRLIAQKFNYNNDNNNVIKAEENGKHVEKDPGVSLIVVASPVPHPSNIEIPLGKYTFLSKHNLNMKFTYADDKLAEFLGWESNELMGQSLFDFHHALDNMSLDKSFKSLFSKGQCETVSYRFLNKTGGYAWVVTQATLIHCSRLQKPLSVVCVNYLLSGVECKDEVYSLRQLEARRLSSEEEAAATTAAKEQQHQQKATQPPYLLAPRKPLAERPVSVTASLFQFHGRAAKPAHEAPPPTTTPTTAAPALAAAAAVRIAGKENEANARAAVKAGVKGKVSIPVCEVSPLQHQHQHQHQRQHQHQQHQQQQHQQPGYTAVGGSPNDPASPPAYETATSASAGCVGGGTRQPPQTATASIFAPRTEDMNKGFLTFSEDQPGLTMLKDEPEDLTHLAPTAGDVCVPLEDPPFLSEMLDEFILSGNYCPLLGTELASGNGARGCDGGGCPAADETDPLAEVEQTILGDPLSGGDECSSPEGDPFMYRDSPSRCSLGTDLHSPCLTKSPGSSGVGESLSSPNGSGHGGLSEDEMLMLSIGDVMGDDELALRAPYIPMSDQDEALQLLISDDMVMWGPSQAGDRKPKWLSDVGEENANSSLAQLLTNESSSRKVQEQNETLVNPALVLGPINAKNIAKGIAVDHERTNKRVHSYSSKSNYESKRIKHNYNNNNNNSSSSSSNNNSGGGPLPGLHNIISASMQNSQLLQQLVSQQQQQQQQQQQHQQQRHQISKGRNWPTSHQLHSGPASNPRLRADLYEDSGLCQLKDEGGGLDDLRDLMLAKGDDDGGRGGTARTSAARDRQRQQQQQSSSVLMNLLVSGCDIKDVQSQFQDPTSPLSPGTRILNRNQQQQQHHQADKITSLRRINGESLRTVPQWTHNSLLNCNQLNLEKQTFGAMMNYENELGFMNSAGMLHDNDEILRALDPNLI